MAKSCFPRINNVTVKGNIFLNNELQSLKINISTRIKYLKNTDRDLFISVSSSFTSKYIIELTYERRRSAYLVVYNVTDISIQRSS